MLTIIKGNKAESERHEINMANIYAKACDRANEEYICDKNRQNIIRCAYYWIKFTNILCHLYDTTAESIPIEHTQETFQLMEAVKDIIRLLTPNELMRIFPITKQYDGERYQSKDYFTTMKELNAHGLDTPIGEAIDNILWAYVNNHLMCFTLNHMGVAVRIYKVHTLLPTP